MRLRARPATWRLRRTITVTAAALLAALGLAVAGGAGGVPAMAATSSCSAAYSVQSDWGSGFTANLNITNNGTAAITGWTVTYTYAGNQTLSNGWNGNWTQSGKTVTVTNASYNGSLAAGASTTAGANFNYSGTNAAPASVTCTPAGSTTPPPGSITATPTSLNVTQGSTGTFTLALSQAPAANETVSVAASGNTGLTESPASLTFTPSNFSTAQTVTVTANASGTGTTTFTASGSGYTAATVSATEVAVHQRHAKPDGDSRLADHHAGHHRDGRDIAVLGAVRERDRVGGADLREHRPVGDRRQLADVHARQLRVGAERDDHRGQLKQRGGDVHRERDRPYLGDIHRHRGRRLHQQLRGARGGPVHRGQAVPEPGLRR